jgi:Zn-dependent M28 family amino/carboxypeptidase
MMIDFKTILFTTALLTGCSPQRPAANSAPQIRTETVFSADSAYRNAAAQLAFGPRVPNTAAHDSCAAWIETELERYGARVSVQTGTAKAYDGTELHYRNIMGSIRPEATNRVLLIAHWDSRHVADNDPIRSKRAQPVPAANDGASGAAILLEIARVSTIKTPQTGIDLLLADAEDYGAPDTWTGQHREEDWALGTQAWAREAAKKGYKADYGILLDMVGASDATFFREYFSERYAPETADLVWSIARDLGYSSLFVNSEGPAITDDHVFVNRIAHIPTIDIIDTRQQYGQTFYPYWHTTDDTLDKLSKETLGKVGHVLSILLFK